MQTETTAATDILDLAKMVLQPVECEWGECQAVLNSWISLLKHQRLHCREPRSKDRTYQCQLPRCVRRDHQSVLSLQTHVELSHMSRVLLPCPIKGCDQVSAKPAYLMTHLEEMHPFIFSPGKLTIHKSRLATLATPIRPSFPSPPPLPSQPLLTGCATSPTITKARQRHSQVVRPSQCSSWKTRLDGSDYVEDTGEATITFDDLPQVAEKSNSLLQDLVIQRKHPKLAHHFAYPQPSPFKAPHSIHTPVQQTTLKTTLQTTLHN